MLDLTNLDVIKRILKENSLWPKKGYGQNFLVAAQPLISLIKAAEIDADDTIIEIGPGLGTLTQELAKRVGLVLAIESDYKMVQWLRKYFKNTKNVKIIHQDILKFPISNFQFPNNFQKFNDQNSKQCNNLAIKQFSNYKLVSNLPYNITSPVIRKFFESNQLPVTSNKVEESDAKKLQATSYKLESMVLMVQKEVAERLIAKPGSADRGILTVMVELFGGAEIVEIVPRKCFYPVPSVDSAIIKINVDPLKINVDPHLLMKFVKIGFSQKRRQIHHPLTANLRLPSGQIKDILKLAEIDPTMRAEDLTLEEWMNLYSKINSKF